MPFKGINWVKEFPNALEMGKAGYSLQEIGEEYGVSRQRIKQVFTYHNIDPASVGVRIRTSKNRETKAKAHFDKWGTREDTDLYQAQRLKFNRKRSNAVRIGWAWTVTFGELLWPTHCPILGIELDYFSEYSKEESPSFDRIDSSHGYVTGNVHIISWKANRIKNNGTATEHRKIADYLDKLEVTV